MKTVDLTHVITPGMPVYPGTEPPSFETGCTLEKDGFVEKKITMFSHTGTHMDAPAHLIADGKTLDEYPAEDLMGKAVVLDVSAGRGGEIEDSWLEPIKAFPGETRFVLLRTGWSRYWGTRDYFEGYPTLSMKAARRLAESDIRGVGVDAISFDPEGSRDLPVHRVFLSRGKILIENLTQLEKLPKGIFFLTCLPLKFKGADGAPVRAVATLSPAGPT